MQALDDDDRASIRQTIDDEILKRQEITFRSTRVQPGGNGGLHVEGNVELFGKAQPIAFDVAAGADGALTARRRGHADGLGDEALLDAVRGTEGRRRGLGQPRRKAADRLTGQSL